MMWRSKKQMCFSGEKKKQKKKKKKHLSGAMQKTTFFSCHGLFHLPAMKYLFEICVICILGLLSSHQTDCESSHFQTKLHTVSSFKQAKQRRFIEGSVDPASRTETDTGSAQERKRYSSENRQDHFARKK